jgi:hypothetical protein
MINFYEFYNKPGLDKEEYSPLLDTLLCGEYTKELEPIKHIIKIMPEHAYQYAYKIIGARFIEAEPYIMKDPFYGLMYAQYVIRGRWIEAEPVIIKNTWHAWMYALYILKSRWIEAEQYIKLHDYWWGKYCRYFKL